MSAPEHNLASEDDSRRKIIMIVAIAAAVVIAGLFYVLMRAGGGGVKPPPRLEGAIRAGSPEFDKYIKAIARDDPVADVSPRALGDIVMTLRTTVRNLTGRTISGLEIWAAVVDHQDTPVKERTVVVIPSEQRTKLEPNETMKVEVTLGGMSDTDDRANIKLEITAFRFK